MEREGYRANGGDRCYFCKAELIDVLTPLAAGARHRGPSRPARTPTTRCAGFRPGIRAADERGAVAPLRDAGPDQGAGPRGLAALGAADLGQAGRGLPVLAGWPTASRSPRTGWPASSAPRPPSAALLAAGRPGQTCGSATSATGPRSRSTRACCRWPRRRTPAVVAAVRDAGFDEAGRRRAGVPLRLDERAAEVRLDPEHVRARRRQLDLVPRRGPNRRDRRVPAHRLPGQQFSDPTVALRWRSERPADELIDDVLDAAHALGRESVNFFELGDATRPPDLERRLRERGGDRWGQRLLREHQQDQHGPRRRVRQDGREPRAAGGRS